MNMIKPIRRGLAHAAISLVCIMAGTISVQAATSDTETALISQTDAEQSAQSNEDSVTGSAKVPSGPASDPELIKKGNNISEEATEDVTNENATTEDIAAENVTAQGNNSSEYSVLEAAESDSSLGATELGTSESESTDSSSQNYTETPREIYAGRFTTTAYCSCRKCCRGGKNRTKSGTIPQAGHTISADLNVFPLGTKLRIGDTIYTVEDSGSGIRGNKLDIFFNSHNQALQYGRQSADVYVVY